MAIILWIGIVITAQAFVATPARHAPAVALGLFPAIAAWGTLVLTQALNAAGIVAGDATLADRDIFGAQGDFPELFDPSVIWTPKQDGDYVLEIADTRGAGGPTYVYRVEIAPPVNTLHVGLHQEGYWPERPRKTSLSVPRGGRWTVRLSLYPGQGTNIKGPFDLAV